LKAEAATPYRGLRKFIYVAFASGFIGALVFLLAQLLGEMLTPLCLTRAQVGVIALMVFLFRWDQQLRQRP